MNAYEYIIYFLAGTYSECITFGHCVGGDSSLIHCSWASCRRGSILNSLLLALSLAGSWLAPLAPPAVPSWITIMFLFFCLNSWVITCTIDVLHACMCDVRWWNGDEIAHFVSCVYKNWAGKMKSYNYYKNPQHLQQHWYQMVGE